MKKTILISLSALSLSLCSCVTGTKIPAVSGIENLNRDAYNVMDEKSATSRCNKFWFLFIPIGGKSEQKREAQCFTRMIKENNADGVLAQKYVHKKITVPLIVFTYSFKYTTLTGKPYRIKADAAK